MPISYNYFLKNHIFVICFSQYYLLATNTLLKKKLTGKEQEWLTEI